MWQRIILGSCTGSNFIYSFCSHVLWHWPTFQGQNSKFAFEYEHNFESMALNFECKLCDFEGVKATTIAGARI